MLVLALSGATAVMGVFYALMEHDLKRLLAYHAVENIGIIPIGLGLALGVQAHGMALAPALAMTAALLHVLDHSLLGACCSSARGCPHRDRRARHGASRRADPGMPQTALAFFRLRRDFGPAAAQRICVGVAHLSGHPVSPQLRPRASGFSCRRLAQLLALSGALAAACFVKAFGVTFLCRPRRPAASAPRRLTASRSLRCSSLPRFVWSWALCPGCSSMRSRRSRRRWPARGCRRSLGSSGFRSCRSPRAQFLQRTARFLFMVISGALAAVTIHQLASDRLRRAPAWDRGYPDLSPITEYTASSFAQPIRRVFGAVVIRAREQVEMPAPGDMRRLG